MDDLMGKAEAPTIEHALLGRTAIDKNFLFVSQFFGNAGQEPYLRFYSPTGIDGLAKEVNRNLEILAVQADEPNTGQFRAFITLAKSMYPQIEILEIWNPMLKGVLKRYDFKPFRTTRNGEDLSGMRWIKKDLTHETLDVTVNP